MEVSLHRVGAVLGAVVLLGCGAYKSYALPVPAHKAVEMFAPLVTAAEEQGHSAFKSNDGVTVDLGSGGYVHYRVFKDDFDMLVQVEDKGVPPTEVQSRLTQAKSTGDTIWKRALELRSEFEHGPKS